ncbi:MAG: hypothetical protein R3Y53_02345 [Bacillota bacterium]
MENTRNETMEATTKKVNFEITVPDTKNFKETAKKFLKIVVPVACVAGLAFSALAVRSAIIATDHANVPLMQAQISDVDFDFDFFLPHFDVEFRYQGVEYDYKVNALTGSILEMEYENR